MYFSLLKMSVSIDNFLKAVYVLGIEEGKKVTGSALAARLGISSAGITDMSRKLSRKGIVDYSPYKEIVLTETGKLEALQVIRKHRLWELFLYKVLNMDMADIHKEAERLEHETSIELMHRLDEFLGFPQYDPHGEPIPSIEGLLPDESDLIPLVEVNEGMRVKIIRISIREKEVYEMFQHYGIKPGIKIEVIRLFDFDGSMEIRIKGEKLILPGSLVTLILCKEGKNVHYGDQ